MAVWTVRDQEELGVGLVLAPERYDPRREIRPINGERSALAVGDIATLIRTTVTAANASDDLFLVLDTSNAREGIVVRPKYAVNGSQIGSAKKVVEPHDVIISRLRPYLRQVAWVDAALWNDTVTKITCSTEFFVLRSLNKHSIAFLVPFFLSQPVQTVLAAAQEGGHHPRFNELTLLTLPLPHEIIQMREKLSICVEKSIQSYRNFEKEMGHLVSVCSEVFAEGAASSH